MASERRRDFPVNQMFSSNVLAYLKDASAFSFSPSFLDYRPKDHGRRLAFRKKQKLQLTLGNRNYPTVCAYGVDP